MRRRWAALCSVLMISGLGASCGERDDVRVEPEAPATQLWAIVQGLATRPQERIEEPEAALFWASLDPTTEFVAAVDLAIAAKLDSVTAYPVRDAGRTFLVDGTAVELHARSWRIAEAPRMGVISYAVTRGTERVDWTELYVPPPSPSDTDALASAFPSGLYRFLVVEPNNTRALSPEEFASTYLPAPGAAPGHAESSSALSVCDHASNVCSAALGLAADVLELGGCLEAAAFVVPQCLLLTGPGVPVCSALAGAAVFFVCEAAAGILTEAVSNVVCALAVTCGPIGAVAELAGSSCTCPFDDGVCNGLTDIACDAISSYSICDLAIAGIPNERIEAFVSFIAPDDWVPVVSTLCDAVSLGEDFDLACTDTIGQVCEGCTANCTNLECGPDPVCGESCGSCPAGESCTSSGQCLSSCGNGVHDPGEACDGDCPITCHDGDVCTKDVMSGAATTCDVQCAHTSILACAAGDGCCPSLCNDNTDADCAAICGNLVVESGELCDGNCPISCDDSDTCTADVLSGTAQTCDAQCLHPSISICAPGDGCCPPACNANNDPDCVANCGNQVVEGGELCDGNCPVSCDDNVACTANVLIGSSQTCNAKCSYPPIAVCAPGDGCCPSVCNANTDADCTALCGNGAQEGNENCGTCPADVPCAGVGLVCFAGACVSCGGIGQPCCGGATCSQGLCNGVSCQPSGPTLFWQEDFEAIAAWDQLGQGTLPGGISVWDASQVLRTKLLSGAGGSAKALGWYGGNVAAVPSSATATLAPLLDNSQDVLLTFDAFSAIGVPMNILVSRVPCATTMVSVSASGWTGYNVVMPACAGGKVVLQVGNVYAASSASQAFKVDNLKLYYQ